MKPFSANSILFLGMMSIPLVAEMSTATPDDVPGTGFEILVYRPFDFAFVLLALVLFCVVNIYYCFRFGRTVWIGALYGIAWAIGWFGITLLVLVELHQGLGGTL